MTVLQEIENKALSLPLPEKGKLIHDLLIAIDAKPEYEGNFEEEIQKRIKLIKSGKAIGISATDVFSKIEAKHR